jgi:hypothetical protein
MDTSYEHPLSILSMKHSIDSFWVGSTRVLFVLQSFSTPVTKRQRTDPGAHSIRTQFGISLF